MHSPLREFTKLIPLCTWCMMVKFIILNILTQACKIYSIIKNIKNQSLFVVFIRALDGALIVSACLSVHLSVSPSVWSHICRPHWMLSMFTNIIIVRAYSQEVPSGGLMCILTQANAIHLHMCSPDWSYQSEAQTVTRDDTK